MKPVKDTDLVIGKEYYFDSGYDTKGVLIKIEKGILYFESYCYGFYSNSIDGYVDFEINNDFFWEL